MVPTYTCFDGFDRIAHGSLPDVAAQLQRALRLEARGPLLLFDDVTGRAIDIDTRGSEQELRDRLVSAAEPRGRGRPKLGVVAREVTLLPRHWDWLAAQSGGASVTLRKLVEQASRVDVDDTRQRHERAYHFLAALAGDLPGFEEAIRALFANDRQRFDKQVGAWPPDVREQAAWLAFGDTDQRPRAAGREPMIAAPGRPGQHRPTI